MLNPNQSNRTSRAKSTGRFLFITLIIAIFAALLICGVLLFEPEKPLVTINKDISFLGENVVLPFQVSDQRSGIKSIKISLNQDKTTSEIFSKDFTRNGWLTKAGPNNHSETVSFQTKGKSLKDGPAELAITAYDFSLNGMLKGNKTIARFSVTIDTKPPVIQIRHTQRTIIPGGSGIVVYSLSEKSENHGVLLNDKFFPGFPITGKENKYISYIAIEWDSKQINNSSIIATDNAGNQGKSIFPLTLRKIAEKHDDITISDGFLDRKIPEFEAFYPELSGSSIDKFIQINNSIREQNSAVIKKICRNSVPEQLWQARFLRMAGASKANFADQRTYYYQGKAIDQQVHLGRDIASTTNVAIKAANHGKVILADYLGIYGNTVIIDHGQGIFSLYSHLSRIDTAPDKLVEKEAVIGHSGATGMAGGDHLHFSMLIHGVFITPIEWWDQHWIDVNITDVLKDTGL